MTAHVQVDEVAHGGYEVVIKLPTVADLKQAVDLAREIRERGIVELDDPRWTRRPPKIKRETEMGYYTRLDGGFTIQPPLTWAEIRGNILTEFWKEYGPFRVSVAETVEDTDQGTRTIKSGVEVEVYTDDACKAYSIEKDLQKLADALPHHRLVGTVTGEGEDAGDYWRLFVGDDGKVVKEKARLIWPDGSEVQPG